MLRFNNYFFSVLRKCFSINLVCLYIQDIPKYNTVLYSFYNPLVNSLVDVINVKGLILRGDRDECKRKLPNHFGCLK